jgi:hypothetical protein
MTIVIENDCCLKTVAFASSFRSQPLRLESRSRYSKGLVVTQVQPTRAETARYRSRARDEGGVAQAESTEIAEEQEEEQVKG